jgi:antitoxin (DNA-binding transcriptional repressor) of toxin-antitoxin stability system
MKRVNVRELHHRTGALIDDVGKGHVILVEKRGVPVAEIRPARRKSAGIPKEHWEWIKKFPAMPGDTGELISEDRDR